MNKSITFDCIKIKQPLGEFYLGAIPFKQLIDITYTDQRRLAGEKDFENYLGIQRPLNQNRVKKIRQYVETEDSCFPTAVIIAVDGKCASFNDAENKLTLSEYKRENEEENEEERIPFEAIAKILDGQHRIEGLKGANIQKEFEINVSIFIDMDIADQAYLFSTVNLAQTKVNKSLVYDLFDLAEKRSPQKVCHNVALVLDKEKKSPFYQKVKRLGVSTQGRFNETIAQATFVEALLKYVSKDPVDDRNLYLKNKTPKLISADELTTYIFRNMFIEEKDIEIADIIWNYFEAIKNKWERAWADTSRGSMLNKTNGFKAFMRFLKPVYLNISTPGMVPKTEDFKAVLKKISLKDEDFNIDNFKPGSSGEGKLYRTLIEQSGL